MRAFVLISCCLALAAARPEPPSGYSYNRPSGGGHSSGGHSSGGGFSAGGGHSSGGFSSGGFSGGHSAGGFSGSSNSFSSGGSNFGSSGFGGSSGGSSFGGSGFGGSSGGIGGFSGGGYSGGSQAAIVQKHIYVHVPPPDQEEAFVQRPIPIAPAQKHYKIIFIKAPSPPQYQAPIIPAQPQNEEKTLVYVLVKKPDAPQDIVIPTAIPTQPSKPEVYFIKYKTQKEAGGAGGYAGSAGGFSGSAGGFAGASSGAEFSGSSSIGEDISHSSNLGISSGGVPSSQYGPPGK